MGVPYAVLWGALAFLFGFIPSVGFLLSLVGPALMALLESGPQAALVVIVAFLVISGGSQNIILRSVKPPEEQKVSEKGSQSFVLQYGLTYTDLQRIRSTIPGVTLVLPARILREYVWNISRRVDCEIVATVPWYPSMRNHRVARGRFFTDQEMEAGANVCVVGAEMVGQSQ